MRGRTAVGIVLACVLTGCSHAVVVPQVAPAALQMRPIDEPSSPSPLVEVQVGSVRGVVPKGWDATAAPGRPPRPGGVRGVASHQRLGAGRPGHPGDRGVLDRRGEARDTVRLLLPRGAFGLVQPDVACGRVRVLPLPSRREPSARPHRPSRLAERLRGVGAWNVHRRRRAGHEVGLRRRGPGVRTDPERRDPDLRVVRGDGAGLGPARGRAAPGDAVPRAASATRRSPRWSSSRGGSSTIRQTGPVDRGRGGGRGRRVAGGRRGALVAGLAGRDRRGHRAAEARPDPRTRGERPAGGDAGHARRPRPRPRPRLHPRRSPCPPTLPAGPSCRGSVRRWRIA